MDDQQPLAHQVYLTADQIYTCGCCHAHLSRNEDIISKGFQGRHGPAYLFKTVHNIALGPKEDRVLRTGLHSVADIACTVCQSVVGWIYVRMDIKESSSVINPLPFC